MARAGKVCGQDTRKGTPCTMRMRGGKCLVHDADLVQRNKAVRAAFARNDPDRYRAHQSKAGSGRTGEKSPRWKGDQAQPHSGRHRAQKLYPLTACAACGAKNGEAELHRHHIDENTLNNAPSNVVILCVPCHAAAHNGAYQWFAQAIAAEPVRPLTVEDLVNL